jgi:hypothetical protein
MNQLEMEFQTLRNTIVPMVREALDSLLIGYRKTVDDGEAFPRIGAFWFLRYTNFFNCKLYITITIYHIYVNHMLLRIPRTISVRWLKDELEYRFHRDRDMYFYTDVYFYNGRFVRFMFAIVHIMMGWLLKL